MLHSFRMTLSEISNLQIDDYSMVRFLPYDQSDEESMNIVLQHIDFAIQYGEDLEFKEPKVISGLGLLWAFSKNVCWHSLISCIISGTQINFCLSDGSNLGSLGDY